ncbi:cell wall biosynthesis glycosyltransferase [Phenylobacterium sp.]|uniref:cell wall biosynthesis glycosyltransferase n=1 Tax=Phenylobacterium sp. TaxID=1871053 RepID=UPI0025D3C2D1|nr:cell wall biosynthesis glycosyltransferase [Phenylobacterium sp.]MBX3485091.1 cell wall biosynthesis glycosyltransferase [Phenylobacterium sp.]MCW5759909.1 cell wall biosynthesis glycosyltransferase [Phenylobacterium sp.]
MLSVIIDARRDADRLPALLAQLTAGAVDGLVRQVAIVAAPGQPGVDALCEDMGADAHPTIPAAARAARADLVLVLPAALRLRDGWIGAFEAHLGGGGAQAVVAGLKEGGVFARTPEGVLVERGLLEQGADGIDVAGVRRLLRLRGGRRIG